MTEREQNLARMIAQTEKQIKYLKKLTDEQIKKI